MDTRNQNKWLSWGTLLLGIIITLLLAALIFASTANACGGQPCPTPVPSESPPPEETEAPPPPEETQPPATEVTPEETEKPPVVTQPPETPPPVVTEAPPIDTPISNPPPEKPKEKKERTPKPELPKTGFMDNYGLPGLGLLFVSCLGILGIVKAIRRQYRI